LVGAVSKRVRPDMTVECSTLAEGRLKFLSHGYYVMQVVVALGASEAQGLMQLVGMRNILFVKIVG